MTARKLGLWAVQSIIAAMYLFTGAALAYQMFGPDGTDLASGFGLLASLTAILALAIVGLTLLLPARLHGVGYKLAALILEMGFFYVVAFVHFLSIDSAIRFLREHGTLTPIVDRFAGTLVQAMFPAKG